MIYADQNAGDGLQFADDIACSAGSITKGRSLQSWAKRAWQVSNRGMTVDIHKVVETDQTIRNLHADAEVFPPAVEFAFRYLQVTRPHPSSVLIAVQACHCTEKLLLLMLAPDCKQLLSYLVESSCVTVSECTLVIATLQDLRTTILLCHCFCPV